MNVTQRGKLTPEDHERLTAAMRDNAEADRLRDAFRAVCVEMIEKSSYREVERLTGVSTNTLLRWKREASQ